MNENTNSKSDISSFSEYLDLENNIPHKLKLIQSIEDKNKFINATIHCLTNIKSFVRHVNLLGITNKIGKIFYDMIILIYCDIKEKKEEYNPEEFCKQILDLRFFEEKSNKDPRVLIEYIFNNLFIENIENQNNISNYIFIGMRDNNSIIDLNSFSQNISNIESKKLELDEYKYILKKERTCSKCKKKSDFYKASSIFKFILDDTQKEYSTYDCFENFLNKENVQVEYTCQHCSNNTSSISESSFYYLPESLIIFIYYGNGEKPCEDFYYKFEEKIEFTKNIDEKVKNKKYFLSSIIVCKYPKKEKEFFYTYAIKNDEKPSYIVYNCKDVRDVNDIKTKICKLQEAQNDDKRSFPYILVYTKIEN